jgi:hypothetical protein
MNKSRVARDLWRKVFNDNLINLSDSDARKQVVKEFLNDPVNKKSGWKSKDARFFRLGFQKVAKENNFNVMNIGVTPTPSRSKTNKGSMNINVKSKQKNPPPMGEAIKPPTEEQKKFGALPQTPQLEGQQAQATYYSAQSVGQIFETIVNIISARTGCSPLSQNERIALGEAWLPIFTEYFSGENSKWVMVAIITIPIALRILSEIQQKKKAKELKEKYGMDEVPKEQLPKKKSAWENMSHGENKTNKK